MGEGWVIGYGFKKNSHEEEGASVWPGVIPTTCNLF